jgi:hypothetical protein
MFGQGPSNDQVQFLLPGVESGGHVVLRRCCSGYDTTTTTTTVHWQQPVALRGVGTR